MKLEILLILLAIIGQIPNAAQVKFLQYVLNVPVNKENREEYFEYICCIGEEQYHSLLPYLCVMDKYSRTELAETYLNFIAAIAVGCFEYAGTVNGVILQRYMSLMTKYKSLVESRLGWGTRFRVSKLMVRL